MLTQLARFAFFWARLRPFLAVDGPRRLYFTRSVLMRCHALALWKSRCRAQHNIISECRVLFLVRCFLANASIPRVMPLGTAGTIDSVNSLRPSWPSVQTLFAFFCVPIRHQPVAVTPVTPYPTGRICWGYLSRHFVPGYDRSVPTGRSSRPEKYPNSTGILAVGLCCRAGALRMCRRKRGSNRNGWLD